MVEQTAVDYANYLHQIDFAKEVKSIHVCLCVEQ